MIRKMNEVVIDVRTPEEKDWQEKRKIAIVDKTRQMNPEKNKIITLNLTEDKLNLLITMAKLAKKKGPEEFLEYLIRQEHYRIMNLINAGVPIRAATKKDRLRIFDQLMRPVV